MLSTMTRFVRPLARAGVMPSKTRFPVARFASFNNFNTHSNFLQNPSSSSLINPIINPINTRGYKLRTSRARTAMKKKDHEAVDGTTTLADEVLLDSNISKHLSKVAYTSSGFFAVATVSGGVIAATAAFTSPAIILPAVGIGFVSSLFSIYKLHKTPKSDKSTRMWYANLLHVGMGGTLAPALMI